MKRLFILVLACSALGACSTADCVSRDFNICFVHENVDNIYGKI